MKKVCTLTIFCYGNRKPILWNSSNNLVATTVICLLLIFIFTIIRWESSVFGTCTHTNAGMVRDQAFHALGDGSPAHLEERVIKAAENLYNDPYPDVKKKARRLLNSYRKTGKWNILWTAYLLGIETGQVKLNYFHLFYLNVKDWIIINFLISSH